MEVDRALVALPDFKSGVPGEQLGRWVRFPCTSAIASDSYSGTTGVSLKKGKRMSKELPHSLPCLDIQAGIRQLEGNQDLYVKLLKKFAECNHDLAEKIADKLADNDNKKARILVHSSKGVSGSIGAAELYLTSAALETAITRAKTEYALQEFSTVLNTVLRSIKALLRNRKYENRKDEEGSSAEKQNLNAEILLPMLDKLAAYLQAGDFKALESYADLKKSVGGTEVAMDVYAWESHINLFQYKQVAEKLALLQLKLRNRRF